MDKLNRPRVALVAGGSGGVGGAICRQLAVKGWDIAYTFFRNGEAARSLSADIAATGRQARQYQVDLRDAEAIKEIVDTEAAADSLNAVVYAAGPFVEMKYISESGTDAFADVLDNDVKGCFNLLQPSILHLRRTRGSIIAVSTPAITRYAPKDLNSVAPKAAIQAIVRGIAVEEGRHGVRANCVGVGLLEGDGMWHSLVSSGAYSGSMLKAAVANIPLRRFGNANDIAVACAFLLSEEAAGLPVKL